MLRVVALLALVGGLLVVAGCGSDSDSTSAADTTVSATTEESDEEEESTPAQALAEIATIRALLDDAVAHTRRVTTRLPPMPSATSISSTTSTSRGLLAT